MPRPTHDDVPPPGDLDLPAAIAAETQYRAAIARGAPEGAAWSAAVELFRMHHPAWPLPLAEREAARVVGALIARRECAAIAQPGGTRRAPPPHLLRALARPASARTPTIGPGTSEAPAPSGSASFLGELPASTCRWVPRSGRSPIA